jgi:hypothetical protein
MNSFKTLEIDVVEILIWNSSTTLLQTDFLFKVQLSSTHVSLHSFVPVLTLEALHSQFYDSVVPVSCTFY